MKLCEGGQLIAITSIATVVMVGYALSPTRLADGSVVTNGARSSAPVVSTAPSPARGGDAISAITAPPVATAEGGPPLPAVARTPHVPSLGNAGLVATIAAGQTVRVLTVDEWRAIQAAYPENPALLARIGTCESGMNPAMHVLDTDGTYTDGAFGVKPQFHGVVPSDLASQAVQAAGILRANGSKPFAGARGCSQWNKD